jgi:hypothetical protein
MSTQLWEMAAGEYVVTGQMIYDRITQEIGTVLVPVDRAVSGRRAFIVDVRNDDEEIQHGHSHG